MATKTNLPNKNENLADEKKSMKMFRLLYPVLVSCELLRQMPGDQENEKEPELFFGAVLKQVSPPVDELSVALCQFEAGEQMGETETTKVVASYYIAIRADAALNANERAVRQLLEQTANVSAWQLFRSLYSQLMSQANESLPALPAQVEIDWETADTEGPQD